MKNNQTRNEVKLTFICKNNQTNYIKLEEEEEEDEDEAAVLATITATK